MFAPVTATLAYRAQPCIIDMAAAELSGLFAGVQGLEFRVSGLHGLGCSGIKGLGYLKVPGWFQ